MASIPLSFVHSLKNDRDIFTCLFMLFNRPFFGALNKFKKLFLLEGDLY